MTTYLEHSTSKSPNFITSLSHFPISKFDSPLLSIAQAAADGVIIVNRLRRIVLVNQKIERIFGYPATQLLEKPLADLMPARFVSEQHRRIDQLAVAHMQSKRSMLELKGVRANGEQFSINVSISRVPVLDELFLALVLHDAVPRPPREPKRRSVRSIELRRWAASSQQANEIEKKRFSKKLYDDIGQRLSVLKLDLDWLENSLPETDANLPARLAQMQGLLDHVITMTKSMASTLRPPLLDDFGLLPAVEWMAENFRKKTAIFCTVENKGMAAKLDDLVASAVFRVVQEGLSNIERHAHAKTAKIILIRTDHQLDVMIQDDGVGMTSDCESKAGCYGLITMRERIFILGGTISIANVNPQGLAIHASIPIDPIISTDLVSYPPTAFL